MTGAVVIFILSGLDASWGKDLKMMRRKSRCSPVHKAGTTTNSRRSRLESDGGDMTANQVEAVTFSQSRLANIIRGTKESEHCAFTVKKSGIDFGGPPKIIVD